MTPVTSRAAWLAIAAALLPSCGADLVTVVSPWAADHAAVVMLLGPGGQALDGFPRALAPGGVARLEVPRGDRVTLYAASWPAAPAGPDFAMCGLSLSGGGPLVAEPASRWSSGEIAAGEAIELGTIASLPFELRHTGCEEATKPEVCTGAVVEAWHEPIRPLHHAVAFSDDLVFAIAASSSRDAVVPALAIDWASRTVRSSTAAGLRVATAVARAGAALLVSTDVGSVVELGEDLRPRSVRDFPASVADLAVGEDGAMLLAVAVPGGLYDQRDILEGTVGSTRTAPVERIETFRGAVAHSAGWRAYTTFETLVIFEQGVWHEDLLVAAAEWSWLGMDADSIVAVPRLREWRIRSRADREDWKMIPRPFSVSANSGAILGPRRYLAGGPAGELAYYDGTRWCRLLTDSRVNVDAVTASPSGRVGFAVGSQVTTEPGLLLRVSIER